MVFLIIMIVFRDMSVPNLQYLTVGQALADVAYFIQILKQTPAFTNSKVRYTELSNFSTRTDIFSNLFRCAYISINCKLGNNINAIITHTNLNTHLITDTHAYVRAPTYTHTHTSASSHAHNT